MTRRSNREGFTLVELLIAIVVFAIVSASLFSLLTRTQRLSRTQAERATMQANVRAGVALVTSELREVNINATQSDIGSMTGTAIQYRGMRGLGFICDHSTTMVRVRRGSWLASYREPIAVRDSILVYVDNNVNLTTDDGWTRREISGVAAATCSADGAIALELTLAAALSPDTVAMIRTGSPIRTYEYMEIGALVQGGETWLGARSMSGGQTFQPVLGPLNTGGVNFQYLNAAGTAGTVLTVKTVVLTLTGITENIVAAGTAVNAGQRATEQLVTRIRLRNAP